MLPSGHKDPSRVIRAALGLATRYWPSGDQNSLALLSPDAVITGGFPGGREGEFSGQRRAEDRAVRGRDS